MKIAIHGDNKYNFSNRWIKYCKKNNISYKIVNAYDNDIIDQINDCTIFMWNHSQANHIDLKMAKPLLYSIEHSGIKVFPDFKTNWHFDDKIGQKYFLESINAPIVNSYVFFNKFKALEWISQTDFPKVFKLRGGAGSMNVFLAKNQKEAIYLTKKAFGNGFSSYNWSHRFNEVLRKLKQGKGKMKDLISILLDLFKKYPNEYSKFIANEKGYVYFQDFIPDNTFDIRVIVVGDKAFALKRINRKNDFRASGSGTINYNKDEIDIRCIEIAFETNRKIKAQSVAYDFVFDTFKKPLIVEISYAYSIMSYDKCEGYWDSNLNWHQGSFNSCDWIIESLIK